VARRFFRLDGGKIQRQPSLTAMIEPWSARSHRLGQSPV
jgi:hypothetical protein